MALIPFPGLLRLDLLSAFKMKNMPRYIILFILLPLLFLLYSCGEGFLDRAPFSQYTSENYWKDETQITAAVTGVYPILRGQFTGSIWRFGEFRSDNTTFQYNIQDRGGLALEELDYFLANSSFGGLGGIWNSSYSGIARINFVLASLPTATFSEAKNRIVREAESRFLRAFLYYHLTINYGAVPLVLEPLTDEEAAVAKRRDPIDLIYSEAIIPDLQFAIEQLPESYPPTETGRATKGAAQMLLAKAHFARRDYQAARPLLDDIANSGNYELLQEYRDVFDPDNKGNREIIFAAEFATAANQGSNFMINWLPFNSGGDITQGVNPGSRAGLNIPTADMIRAYEQGDRRFDASVGFYIKNQDTIPYIKKYVFPPIVTGGTNVNWPVFRYADALLMQAESILELESGIPDKVFEIINLIRVRAGLPLIFPGNPVPELNIDTEEKLREFLRKERRVELAFESWRWYDLQRYGNAVEIMQAHGQEQKELQSFLDPFPDAYTNIKLLYGIPAGQVLQYGYEQNPGW